MAWEIPTKLSIQPMGLKFDRGAIGEHPKLWENFQKLTSLTVDSTSLANVTREFRLPLIPYTRLKSELSNHLNEFLLTQNFTFP